MVHGQSRGRLTQHAATVPCLTPAPSCPLTPPTHPHNHPPYTPAGKPFNPVTKGKALAGLAHSLSMSELGMSEQIRLALNTIGAMDFGRVRSLARGGGGVAGGVGRSGSAADHHGIHFGRVTGEEIRVRGVNGGVWVIGSHPVRDPC